MNRIKLLLISLITVIFFNSCAFYSKGKIIDNYNAPKTALLILDIQEDFTGTNAKMPVDMDQAKIMIKNINLITNSIDNEILKVYIKNEFSKNDKIANFFRNNAAVIGNDGLRFDERLNIASKNVFVKSKPSAFSNIEFENFLIENNVSELYISGVFAEQCVYWTSKAAISRGYKLNYIKDAVASSSDSKVENAIKKIQKDGAQIVQTTDLLTILNE